VRELFAEEQTHTGDEEEMLAAVRAAMRDTVARTEAGESSEDDDGDLGSMQRAMDAEIAALRTIPSEGIQEDLHTLRNLLQALEEQRGAAGPASTLLDSV
jgi:O-methyltransferase involved in polyketide biosynthesis